MFEPTTVNVEKVKYIYEIEKRRGFFAHNYIPYNPVGSMQPLEIEFPLPKSIHEQEAHVKPKKIYLHDDNRESLLNGSMFSRHSKLPIHPSIRNSKRKLISYTGGYSNIQMELRMGEERLKSARIGKPYQEILLEQNPIFKDLVIPGTVSYQNIQYYLKKLQLTKSNQETNTKDNSFVQKELKHKIVISQKFRPMLLLCRILASLKADPTTKSSDQEKTMAKIYTIFLLLNGIYNIRAKDLKCKFPLTRERKREVIGELDEQHRHYSHHNLKSSFNHYHHHYTCKNNTQQPINPNSLVDQTVQQNSGATIRNKHHSQLHVGLISSNTDKKLLEDLANYQPLWHKLLLHPMVEREDHIRKKLVWDVDELGDINQEWSDKFDHINLLNAKDVEIDLAEWRKEMKARIEYKMKYFDCRQTFLKAIFNMRDKTVYSLEEDSLKKGKGYSVWLQNLEVDARSNGVSNRVQIVLNKLKKSFGAEEVKAVPHAKEKLCLLFFSMPCNEVIEISVIDAFKFVLKEILHDNPDYVTLWIKYRNIPLPIQKNT